MQEFNRYKTFIDADLAAYCEVLTKRWQQELGLDTAQILDSYLAILSRGGKRLRGALGMWAYDLARGKDDTLAIRVARALEMIHAYLLVVDDVADQSEVRRGGPTAHILLQNYHQAEKWFGDAAHFGRMQAINAGIALQHLVMKEIAELPAPDVVKLEALRELNAVLFKTVTGQIADLNFQAIRNITEHEVIAMMTQKTAHYSFVSPLQFGIIMAGKDWSDFLWLEQWAINMGLGFQINDDVLGIFGDEKLSGKSTLDDIHEGKITLLMVRALESGNENQKSQLLRCLGSPEATRRDLEQVQTILEDSGALAYCQGLAQNYTQKAIANLDTAPAAYQDQALLLRSLSEVMVARQS